MSLKKGNYRSKLYEIVFEADTPAGKLFDIFLLVAISASIILVMLESVSVINTRYGSYLLAVEWCFTIMFTLEYFLRIIIVKRPWVYIASFYGIIDFLAILPTYLTFFFVGTQVFIVLRSLRLLRIFRILRLTHYLHAGSTIIKALKAGRIKISVFLYTVIMIVIIMGTIMYLVEGGKNNFTSIPQSIYWAVVTLTTVGYGDVAPVTTLGKFIASFIMILGYAIIAVPTGIVTAELAKPKADTTTQVCPECLYEGHDSDAIYCKKCGCLLNELT